MCSSSLGCAREGLIGAAAAQDHGNRLEEDAKVASQRYVLHVVELDRQTLGEVQIAPSVDLHWPGHARLDVEPEGVLRAVALDQLDLLRARPDHAHLATQDVDQLRQLVEAQAAQQPPGSGDPRISP